MKFEKNSNINHYSLVPKNDHLVALCKGLALAWGGQKSMYSSNSSARRENAVLITDPVRV